MPKKEDIFTGDMFKSPEVNDETPLMKEYRRNERGEIIDTEGAVYDKKGDVIREKESEPLARALELVRKTYPDAGPKDELVQHYVREFRRQEENKKK